MKKRTGFTSTAAASLGGESAESGTGNSAPQPCADVPSGQWAAKAIARVATAS